jgi:arylsulfatase A-like enzyme
MSFATERVELGLDGAKVSVMPHRYRVLVGILIVGLGGFGALGQGMRPNVLFISVDDLNDWIGCLGGHPQARTPNLDRLAASGVLFDNAHCPGPACNPSRTAIMTGLAPNQSGMYSNRQKMREVLPDADIIPRYFSDRGYWSGGSGKILHYFIDAQSWDDYYPAKETENPFPRTHYPPKRPVNLPRGGPWQYVETDWAALPVDDEEYGGDWLVSKWISEQLEREHAKPFFLACGIYRPHEPWFVPSKYYELFPLDSIVLPPGYKEDDLDDLPPAGKKRGPNRYFAHIREQGQWKKAIQSYLASIAFADAMLGRVLDALDRSAYKDNTIVVLWSDHGWHLGEKQHWQKYTAWRGVTRVPLMIRAPVGVPGLARGTEPGRSSKPVNLLSLFPTLLELCGMEPKKENHSPSLVPLLKNPKKNWPHKSVTFLAEPGSYGLSGERWRYIHYANGDEELYDIESDPYEWSNLASLPKYQGELDRLRELGPKQFVPYKEASVESLLPLAWSEAGGPKIPPSRPEGNPFDVFFLNRRTNTVELFWQDQSGGRKSYGMIQPEETLRQQTRPGAVWSVEDSRNKAIGYFRIGDRSARGVIE